MPLYSRDIDNVDVKHQSFVNQFYMPRYSWDIAKVGVNHQLFGNQVYMPRYSRDTAKVGVKHQSFGNQVYMPRYSRDTDNKDNITNSSFLLTNVGGRTGFPCFLTSSLLINQ
jgi:hypothetical protein